MNFIHLFSKYVDTAEDNLPKTFRKCDNEIKKLAGVNFFRLDGCPKCNRHVYTPEDRRTRCPVVKANGEVCGAPRFDNKGKAFETVFYFPLAPRLRSLLSVKSYVQMLQHEHERPKPTNPNLMADVYDSEGWQEFMGPPTFPIMRIGLQFCIDAIPAFAAGTLSLKPAEFINLSLPPGIRNKSANILLLMLMPASLGKGQCQKKYYDFAAQFELNDLARKGRCEILCVLSRTLALPLIKYH